MTGTHLLAAHQLPHDITSPGETGFRRGNTCFANAHYSNHERLLTEELGGGTILTIPSVEAAGLARAMLLHVLILIVPVTSLVFFGG